MSTFRWDFPLPTLFDTTSYQYLPNPLGGDQPWSHSALVAFPHAKVRLQTMDPKAEPVGTCGKIWGMMGIMLDLYVDSMGVLWGPNKESILMRFQRMALRIRATKISRVS